MGHLPAPENGFLACGRATLGELSAFRDDAMTQRHLYLLLGCLDDETARTECLLLPMDEFRVRAALQAAFGSGGRICGAVVPVSSDGPPTGYQVATVIWAAARGWVRPLTDFVLAPGQDVEPIVAAVLSVQAAEGLEAGFVADRGPGMGPR